MDEHSRMIQPQFLNRDTYGRLPGVDRQKDTQSTYQVIYNAAADVRESFACDEELSCRPFAISAPQSEFLGPEQDSDGRESLNFTALNACLTGYNPETQEPFSIVGHLEVKMYKAPDRATTPWALEAPYVTRQTLRETLDNYAAYERPFFAFPDASTSLRPCLDYLQPNKPYHPPSILKPAGESVQTPNVPRIPYCTPPLEADTQEAGRAIHNSAIVHARWQPSAHYRFHEIPPASSPHAEFGATWEYMGQTETGAQRWPPSPPASWLSEDLADPHAGELAKQKEESSDEDNEEFDSDEYDADASPPLSPYHPARPLESGDSYFPPQPIHPLERVAALAPRPRPSYTPEESPSPTIQEKYRSGPPVQRTTRKPIEQRTRVDNLPYTIAERRGRPLFPNSISSPTGLITLSDSEDDFSTHSSTESVCSSMTSSSDAYSLPELLYPPSPSPVPTESAGTPVLRGLSTPVATPTALVNLPHTTPIPKSSPGPQTTVLGILAHAALSRAERMFNGFKMTPPASSSMDLREMDERIKGLEAHRSSQLQSTPPLRDPSTHPSFTKDVNSATTPDTWVERLAERLREPQIYHAVVEAPAIDTNLLLGFSKGITIPEATHDTFTRSFQQASTAARASFTPCPSPIITPHGRDLHRLDDALRTQPQSPVIPLSTEDLELIQDIFDLDDVDDDEDLRVAAMEEAAQDRMADQAAEQHSEDRPETRRGFPGLDSSPPSTPDHTLAAWGPVSRRPMRNEDGEVTYDRARYGWHDFRNGNPPWLYNDRRRDEAIGYALEFPDSAILQLQGNFRTKLMPNLHQQRLSHTEDRLKLESAHAEMQRRPHYGLAPRPELPPDVYPTAEQRNPAVPAHLVPFPYHDHPRYLDQGFNYAGPFAYGEPTTKPRPLTRYALHREHDVRTHDDVSPIERSIRHYYKGSYANPNPARSQGSFKDHDDQPTKRRKIQEPSMGDQVVCAEAFKTTVTTWQAYMAGLRTIRGNIFFTIQRLMEVVEELGGRAEFRRLFFPFEEEFPIKTIREMYEMERVQNPDGYFRRAPYHLNPLLHDAEANFLQACLLYFRHTHDLELAFTLEELLSVQFRDDGRIRQLLRSGFLTTSYDFDTVSFNSTHGSLEDRFAEFNSHYADSEDVEIM
ncbi:hypothetical protein C8R46DRAFT_1220258 [Mycena filopes]|nr:hypothetical protein C8R46DRAFT_1220258 [Mycena filopes]